MKTLNVLEQPEHPKLPECENDSVGSISRDDIDIAWLAGIIDGEGSVTIMRQKRENGKTIRYSPRFEVRNTNPYMLEKITVVLSKMNIRFFSSYIKRPENGVKECMAVIVSAQNSLHRLFHKVFPHLTAKKMAVEAMLEYLDWRSQYGWKYFYNGDRNILREKLASLKEVVRSINEQRYSLQRLPRRGSKVIDLKDLESVV